MGNFNRLVILVLAALASCSFASADTAKILDLKATCSLALQKNPDLAASKASVEQSSAALNKSKSMQMPSLSIKSNYFHIDKPTFFGTTPVLEKDTLTNRVELVQPIFTGGQLQANVSASKSGLKAANSGYEASKNQVVTNVAASYFRARQAKEAVVVAQSSVESNQSSYDDATKLFDAGVVTKSDVLRAEVVLTTSKDQLIQSQNDYDTALAALKTAIGLPQTEKLELADNATDAIPVTDNIQPKQRAEVEAADYAVQSANARLKAAHGESAPTVSMMVDYENEPQGSQFPRRSNTIGVSIMASMKLFDGGGTRADIEQAKASVDQAKAGLESASRSTELQLESAKLAVASSKARSEMLSTQIKSAEESFRVVQSGYREGINVLTDVQSVETMLTRARVSKLTADYDLKIAELNLLYAMGQTELLTDQEAQK